MPVFSSLFRPSDHLEESKIDKNNSIFQEIECGSNSVVECQLPKLDVAGSSPVSRSINPVRIAVHPGWIFFGG